MVSHFGSDMFFDKALIQYEINKNGSDTVSAVTKEED